MTHWTEAADMLDGRDDAPPSAGVRYAPGAFAFIMSAALGLYLVYLRPNLFKPTAALVPPVAAPSAIKPDAFGGLVPVMSAPSLAANPFGALVTKGFDATTQFSLAEQAPIPPVAPPDLRSIEEADAPPLPPRRPSVLAVPRQTSVARPEPHAAAVPPTVADAAPVAGPGLFEKLFGGADAARNAAGRPQDQKLAYAAPPPTSTASTLGVVASGRGGAPTPGGFGGFLRGLSFNSSPSTKFGDHVAVYDISAHIVYLPDGTKLEAHSGLGSLRDDPGSSAERMRGVTPPATYALTPREASFHGVDALRLTPLDSGVYGRAGLLAHSYMLGPDGDSNGCVSFRDYDAFLRAYRSGQISKLVVVTRL